MSILKNVTLKEPYSAWRYEGGSELPPEVDKYLSQYHWFHVEASQADAKHVEALKSVRPDWDGYIPEYIYWSHEGNNRCSVGMWIVFTDGGPVPMHDDDLEVVPTESPSTVDTSYKNQ